MNAKLSTTALAAMLLAGCPVSVTDDVMFEDTDITATGTAGLDDSTGATSSTGAGTSSSSSSSSSTGPQLCGNFVIDVAAGEECDVSDFGELRCADFENPRGEPFDGGTLICDPELCTVRTSSCLSFFCGDGAIIAPEQCEGDVKRDNCFFLGLGSGDVTCGDNCRFDFSGCDTCGDGNVTSPEECDGSVGEATCESQGFVSGRLACSAGCTFDFSGCR